MLEIKDLHAYYGPIEALKGVSLTVPDGITSLIGSNGAGKTTLLKSISGMIKRTGSITLDGEELTKKKATQIAKCGISHCPEGRHVFPGLSVEQNLETGTITWHGFFGRAPFSKELEEEYTLFPRLKERRNQLAWSLSGGEQQMLAIGRAIMARPKFLLLDEPSMGLAPLVVAELFEKIVEINRVLNVPILVVEQNAKMVMKISQYSYVLENGKISMEGKSSDLINDPRIVAAYLGKLATNEQKKDA